MQTTRYCGNHPESWVRGSAKLDTQTGTVVVEIQLETDSTLAGPRGKIVIEIRSDAGKLIGTIESNEVGIGGKLPGRAASRTYSSQMQLPESQTKRAAALTIQAACTGSAQQLFGITGDPTRSFALAIK